MNKMIARMCTLYCFLSYSLLAFAQSHRIDSLKRDLEVQKEDSNKVNTLIWLSEEPTLDAQMAIQYARHARELAARVPNYQFEGVALRNLGQAYLRVGGAFEALNCFDSSIQVFQSHKDKRGEVGVLNSAGNLFLEWDLMEGLEFLQRGLRIAEDLKDTFHIAMVTANIATYQSKVPGRQDDAILNYKKAIALSSRALDSTFVSSCLSNIAELYLNKEALDSALHYCNAAATIDSLRADTFSIVYETALFGKIFERRKEYGKALHYFTRLFDAAQIVGFEHNLYEALMGMGDVHMATDDNNSALDFYKEAEKLLSGISDPRYKDVYAKLALTNEKLGQFSEAYRYQKKSLLGQDTFYSRQLNLKLDLLRKNSDIRKKQDSTLRVKNNELYQLEISNVNQRNRTRVLFFVSGLFVLIILLGLLYRNNRHKQKSNLLLTQKKDELQKTLKELTATQAQLIQSEKMASLGELTAGIAHEIQNPLNFVNNFSEVNAELIEELHHEAEKGNLHEIKSIASDIRENERKINQHGKRADSIVKGMLQHSRIKSGQKELTDVNALSDEYLRLAYHGLRAKDNTFSAKIETNFDSSLEKINVVPQDIGRVILNLINNAFYAVTERKEQVDDSYEPCVSIRTTKLADRIEIAVKDNGNGIPEKIKGKIFQPFFTTKPTGQGTGLGLSLAYDIIKAHGGEVKVETKENEGSAFFIILPLSN